ncbi:MAG: TraB/GumN family protein [Saprospiraceae bacterium]|nr:TraB/GumN family protein [Saprospiraceae bacterium]
MILNHVIAQEKLAHSLLWKVTDPQTQRYVYIFGTIHMIPESDFFWPQQLDTAIKQSGKIVFEIDMNEIADPNKIFELMPLLMMRNDTSLVDLLSVDEMKVISDHFEKLGLPMILISKFKPLFLSVMASDGISGDALQSGNYKSYELVLQNLADSLEKETGGLETINFQVSLFDAIPYKSKPKCCWMPSNKVIVVRTLCWQNWPKRLPQPKPGRDG